MASDASEYGIGAILKVVVQSQWHMLQELLVAERNYSQIEKESLAIFALKIFYKFVQGRKFVLQTDHHPLLSIFRSKKGILTHTANILQHWGTFLLNSNYKMKFLPSKKLGHADGLSRLVPSFAEPLEDNVIAASRAKKELKEVFCNKIQELLVTLDEIKIIAEKDDFTIKRKEQIKMKEKTFSVFSICDEVLMYANWVVTPLSPRKRNLKEFHLGHLRISFMKSLMRNYTYWPQMDHDIEKVMKTCRGCALAAKSPPVKFQP